MSKWADSQVCAVVEGLGVYDLHRRRNALPFIFEDVDVMVMMKKLDVNPTSITSCNSWGTPSSSTSLSGNSSASCNDVTEDLCSCSDSVTRYQCECRQVKRSGQHREASTSTHHSATASRCCYTQDKTDTFPRRVTSAQSGSREGVLQPGSSSCTAPEREKNVSRDVAACVELSDNFNALACFRPEDCAKRSLIF